MYWLIDENVVIRDFQKPNPIFSLGSVAQYLLLCVHGDFIGHNYSEYWELTVQIQKILTSEIVTEAASFSLVYVLRSWQLAVMPMFFQPVSIGDLLKPMCILLNGLRYHFISL